MAILNLYNFPYIQSPNNRDESVNEPLTIRTHGGFPGTALRNWDDKDYWYIEFVNGAAFWHYPLTTLVPTDIFQKIKNGEVTLVISNSHEAYHYVIEDLYKDIILKYNINPQNILYLSNSRDIKKEIEIVSKKYNMPPFTSEYIVLFEFLANYEILHNSTFYKSSTLLKLFTKTYTKKYISFNGLYRPHRSMLVSLLSVFDVLEDGYVSLNSSRNYSNKAEEFYEYCISHYTNNPEIINLLIENKEKLLQLNSLYIDILPGQPWIGADYKSSDKVLYENTYFSVVTETLCYPDYSQAGHTLGRAISEKTFKPIINKHPFLILGVPKVLEFLRELGYRTFSSVIDESYDLIDDPIERTYRIAMETKRLCNLSSKELKDFQIKCYEITEYNYKVLKNKTKFSHSII